MEFLSEYASFLAKTLTLVVAIVVVLVAIAATRGRGRRGSGQLQVQKLNDFYKDLRERLEHSVLSKDQLKATRKAQAKAAKQEKKAPPSKPRVFVLDFDGDIKASATDNLRHEVTALLSMAMLPLTLMRTETPSLAGTRSVTIAEIYRSSPLAIVATLASGLAQSAFFSMGSVYALMQGLPLALVSVMLALPPLALIVSQYPAGLLSDRYDRRSIIMILSAIAAAIALISIPAAGISSTVLIALFTVFGAIALPIYSLVIAHANDHMAKEQMLGASSKLVLLYGTGAMAGPSIAGFFMQYLGSSGFMTFMAVVYVIMAVHALWRRKQRPTSVKATASDILKAGPMTTPVAAQAQAEEGAGKQAGPAQAPQT